MGGHLVLGKSNDKNHVGILTIEEEGAEVGEIGGVFKGGGEGGGGGI